MAYAKERRYVLRQVANMIEAALSNGDEWLRAKEDAALVAGPLPREHAVDQFAERRRALAAQRLVTSLRKQADRSAARGGA